MPGQNDDKTEVVENKEDDSSSESKVEEKTSDDNQDGEGDDKPKAVEDKKEVVEKPRPPKWATSRIARLTAEKKELEDQVKNLKERKAEATSPPPPPPVNTSGLSEKQINDLVEAKAAQKQFIRGL